MFLAKKVIFFGGVGVDIYTFSFYLFTEIFLLLSLYKMSSNLHQNGTVASEKLTLLTCWQKNFNKIFETTALPNGLP